MKEDLTRRVTASDGKTLLRFYTSLPDGAPARVADACGKWIGLCGEYLTDRFAQTLLAGYEKDLDPGKRLHTPCISAECRAFCPPCAPGEYTVVFVLTLEKAGKTLYSDRLTVVFDQGSERFTRLY